VRQIPAADGAKRQAYRFSEQGLALRHLLKPMRDWGLKWGPGTDMRLEPS
jgi:DNA-binding HxlR family transcriptional regulator